ncbi:MAG: MogA/MoaB family molybdenum cofactor biosynthesis protein [Actinomycetia bacterium]|nr:MogA/MoaB family molybdenum cofactor biosynthesis protein [Actinomycetes bacterium]
MSTVRGRRSLSAAVITLSDKASAGLRADASGPVLKELLAAAGFTVGEPVVISDDQALIEHTLAELADRGDVDLILTTGGTGLAPRDRTPEATMAMADRLVPGVAEAMRAASLSVTPQAMLSRAVAAVRKKTLIINMPGSPKACREHFAVIAPVLDHAIETVRGEAFECAPEDRG